MRLRACLVLLMSGVALAQEGRLVFGTRCSVCHGTDAHGTARGPSLAGNREVRARSIGELREVIHKGIPEAGMPAFDLPAAELDTLAAFVASLNATAAGAHAPGDRVAGERFFFGS